MDQFQCYVCGMKSLDQEIVKNHLNNAHNIKVEIESLNKYYCCSLCSYNTENMNEYKSHQINTHKKEAHNWMVDNIVMEYKCKECDVEFPTQASVKGHMEEVHNSDHNKEIIKKVIYQEKKEEIIPDENLSQSSIKQ